MDSLISITEPQLVIPVIGVVLCAVLVYIFGFQQTQEPSFQHLAVLQSSGKSKHANGFANKQKSQPVLAKTSSPKPKEKVVSNGNAVHVSSGKENVKPQQPPTPKTKKEKISANVKPVDADIEDGDWIQAVSRKDKKTRVKKEETKPASLGEKEKGKKSPSPPANKPRTILEEIEYRAKLEQNANKNEEVTKKPKEAEKPVKQEAKVKEVEVVVPKEEPKEKVIEKVEIKAKDTEKAQEIKDASDNSPKNNVAFDEVGDLWEEAKSRGAKKKRARKD